MGSVTSVVPFSVAEILIYMIPLLAILAVVISFIYAKTARLRVRMLAVILSILMPLYPMYMLTLAPGYHAPSLEKQMGLHTQSVTDEELRQTAQILLSEITPLLDSIAFDEGGSSQNPHTLKEMGEEILVGYDRFLSEYPIAESFRSVPKPVLASEWMTYAGITGVYTFFTGESNINVFYPDFVHPFTVAHELAHQRGIARENEANFVAALVCARADSAYVRYSGLFNLLEYVLVAYASADFESYRDFWFQMDTRIADEVRAYTDFLEPYKDHVVGEVSDKVNDAYLEMNGTPGIVSYGLVVDLAVAYYTR